MKSGPLNWDRVFSVDRWKWDPGDGTRVGAGAPLAMKFTSSAMLNPLGWTCRKTIFISIESMLRTILCFHVLLPLARKMAEVAYFSSSISSCSLRGATRTRRMFWPRRC